jgi:four helix bundle protein
MRTNLQLPKSNHQGPEEGTGAAAGTLNPYAQPEERSWILDEEAENRRHPFDLEGRTARFGEAIVRFLKRVPRGPHNDRLIDQLTGCGTSIGANYCEANESVSRKDFRNIIGRCCKEANAAKFFLRLIAASEPQLVQEARELHTEARELHLIFCSIYRKTAPAETGSAS